MNKKLVFIVSLLLLAQVGIYFLMEEYGWKINQAVGDTRYLPDREGNIDLSDKELFEIPEEVFKDDDLKIIDIANNNLSEFPYELLAMPNLEVIYLQGNKIWEVDFSRSPVKNSSVKKIFLSLNNLKTIENIAGLPNLESIDLSTNRFSFIPNLNGSSLKALNLSGNRISYVSSKMFPSTLEILNLNENEISQFRQIKDSMEYQLRVLDLSKNPFEHKPYDAFKFPNLTTLLLEDVGFYTLKNQQIVPLNYLKTLVLTENRIEYFDLDINQYFPKLKSFAINYNNLIELNLNHEQLQNCYINNNDSTSVRLNLPNLQVLEIDYLQLKDQMNKIQIPEIQKITLDIGIDYYSDFQSEFYKNFPNVAIIEKQ